MTPDAGDPPTLWLGLLPAVPGQLAGAGADVHLCGPAQAHATVATRPAGRLTTALEGGAVHLLAGPGPSGTGPGIELVLVLPPFEPPSRRRHVVRWPSERLPQLLRNAPADPVPGRRTAFSGGRARTTRVPGALDVTGMLTLGAVTDLAVLRVTVVPGPLGAGLVLDARAVLERDRFGIEVGRRGVSSKLVLTVRALLSRAA